MKLLIDENLLKILKQHFPKHDIFTVRDMGWQSEKNGELLALMLATEFDVLITFDKISKTLLPITVLVLLAYGNAFPFLEPLIPYIHKALNEALPLGATVISLP